MRIASHRWTKTGWQARHQHGQALVLIAITLPVLIAFVLTAVEVAGRTLQRAEIEDALAQATRVTLQTFNYHVFAEGRAGIRSEEMEAIGQAAFVQNLRDVSGLGKPATAMANDIKWTFLPPGGGTCFSATDAEITFTTAAVCAELTAALAGMPLRGNWSSLIRVAATLDEIDQE